MTEKIETDKIYKKINELKGEEEEVGQYLKDLEVLAQYSGEDEVISSARAKEIVDEEKKKITLKFNTSIPQLDDLIGGFREGQVVVVSGPTGTGKTTFCQTLTSNFAQNDHKCLWFTYEVGVAEFLDKFPEVPLFFLPKQLKQNSLVWLEQRIMEAIAKYDCKIVFIDHLHYLLEMQKMAEAKSLSLLIGMMMRELKKMAIRHQITIFLVSHLRKTMLEKEKLPELDDLRDSSFIAQESDIVLFIKRLKGDGDAMTDFSALRVAKNRRTGNLGVVKLYYANNKFTEVEERYEQNY